MPSTPRRATPFARDGYGRRAASAQSSSRLAPSPHRDSRATPRCPWYRTAPSVHWVLDLPGSYDAFLSALSRARGRASSATSGSWRRSSVTAFVKVFRDRRTRRAIRRPRPGRREDVPARARRRVRARRAPAQPDTAHDGARLVPRLRALTSTASRSRSGRARPTDGVFPTGVPGFDPAYADLRVGNYVLLRLIADLCADESIDTLDYGFGDAEYKRRFGTRSWLEQDVHVFARRRRVRGRTRPAERATARGARRRALRRGNVDRPAQAGLATAPLAPTRRSR